MLQRRLPHAFALAVAVASSDILTAWSMLADSPKRLALPWAVRVLLEESVTFLFVVVVLTAIQARMKAGPSRVAAMLTAVVAIAAGLMPLSAFRRWWRVIDAEETLYLISPDRVSLSLYLMWGTVVIGGLLAMLYEWHAKSESVVENVRNANIARERAERAILESRMSSLNARVDPELLFAVVARAKALYGDSVAAGEKLLEQLIEFLRALLPQPEGLKVSVEQEVMLCRLYLELEKAMHEAFTYETRADPALTRDHFPPAVLLPVLRAVMGATATAPRQLHLSIAADCEPACVRIDITCHAPSPPPPREALERASAALRKFFGDGVSVVATAAPFSGRLVRIEVPHVPA